jgi:hypothetical protein
VEVTSPSGQQFNLNSAQVTKRAEEADRLARKVISDSLTKPTRLTSEEKALLEQGQYIEMIGGGQEHSGHLLMHIKVGDGKTERPTVGFVFGIEDVEPARKEGESMAAFQYTKGQAEQFLFAEGWDKYHDRFFTRYYVQVGIEAYEKALARQGQRQKPGGKAAPVGDA